MSTTTFTATFETAFETGPVLASDLPPVAVPAPRAFETVRTRFHEARDRRAFQRALRLADHDERHDLLTLARRM